VGPLKLVASGEALVAVYLPTYRRMPALDAAPVPRQAILDQAARELEEYFSGGRRDFTTRLGASGTVFQTQVWNALGEIPYGARWSYGQLARAVGRPKAARAVGMANGSNPLPIFVPCHRVVGSDGSLTGYGGGLETKRWLLDLEGRVAVSRSG
jgi:methylated-DNA-[protein]-cysteine S-methyltransferase